MKRAAPLAMVQEQGPIGFPRGRLPDDQVDSIPVAKYATAKRRCLAGNIATGHPNPSKSNYSAMSQATTLRANFKDTIQHYWSMIHGPGNADTTQHPVREVQQSCSTCTEDFYTTTTFGYYPADTYSTHGASTHGSDAVQLLAPYGSRFDIRIAWVESYIQSPPMARMYAPDPRHV
ncbi:hypothetical protein ABKA04_005899 [Annulohypoxylon sp. FPYF3050]